MSTRPRPLATGSSPRASTKQGAGGVAGHDVVVVGASMGGVDALQRLVASLPADLPATVLVVQHMFATHESRLPEILSARGPLRAHHAIHGEEMKRGEILVAPPDNHLLVREGYVHVVRGPKENGHRPSVDALFRSASSVYENRVVGVVLTGQQDCGTAGLLSIKARGGVAIVEDPETAYASEMPASAVAHVDVDHIVPLHAIGPLIAKVVTQKPTSTRTARSRAASDERVQALEGAEPGAPANLVCPLCNGVLTEVELNGFTQFRCHVGHAFSLENVAGEQGEQIERALWASVRALEEGAALAARLARTSAGDMRASFEERERTQRQQADIVRRILLGPPPPAPPLPPPAAATTKPRSKKR